MAFTPEEQQEILDIVAGQSVTPQQIPQAATPSDVLSLPGIDASGEYKMVRLEDIAGDATMAITETEIDTICV